MKWQLFYKSIRAPLAEFVSGEKALTLMLKMAVQPKLDQQPDVEPIHLTVKFNRELRFYTIRGGGFDFREWHTLSLSASQRFDREMADIWDEVDERGLPWAQGETTWFVRRKASARYTEFVVAGPTLGNVARMFTGEPQMVPGSHVFCMKYAPSHGLIFRCEAAPLTLANPCRSCYGLSP